MSTLKLIWRLALIALVAAFALSASAVERDFDGDGKSDLSWFAPGSYPSVPGGSAIWLMSGTTPVSGTLIGPTGWWWVAHTGDLNGDGTADMIIRDKWTGTTGVRLMQGTAEIASAALHTSEVTVVTHVGDFDGDGKTDLIWTDSSAGVTALWLMDGVTVKSQAWLLVDPNWRVSHVADFNGDGRADLVWANARTWETAIWLMDGTKYLEGAVIMGISIVMPHAYDWYVAQTGDFNGDGKADLVWARVVGKETAIWLMEGTSMTSGAIVVSDPNWHVSAVTDLNGDGRDDLVWQKILDDGINAWIDSTIVWLMDGLTMTASNSVPLGDTWVVSVGDFDGDGRGDLITQRCFPLSECYFNHDALFSAWLMDGLQIKATAPLMRSDYWYLGP